MLSKLALSNMANKIKPSRCRAVWACLLSHSEDCLSIPVFAHRPSDAFCPFFSSVCFSGMAVISNWAILPATSRSKLMACSWSDMNLVVLNTSSKRMRGKIMIE